MHVWKIQITGYLKKRWLHAPVAQSYSYTHIYIQQHRRMLTRPQVNKAISENVCVVWVYFCKDQLTYMCNSLYMCIQSVPENTQNLQFLSLRSGTGLILNFIHFYPGYVYMCVCTCVYEHKHIYTCIIYTSYNVKPCFKIIWRVYSCFLNFYNHSHLYTQMKIY